VFQSDVNPMFRSKFSEDIFNAKYRHTGCETWAKLADVLVEDVCGKQSGASKNPHHRQLLSDEEIQLLKGFIRNLKFIPGGRYLYYAGRTRRYWNNCLDGGTIIATRQGWRRLDSFREGEKAEVLSPVTGSYLPATMHCHGKQPVQKITFAPVRGRSLRRWTVTATRTHHWPLIDGSNTYDLRIGDVVPAGAANLPFWGPAFVHGLVFADGTLNHTRKDGTHVYQLRLCGEKAKHLGVILELDGTHRRQDAENGDPIVAIETKTDLKAIPCAWPKDADDTSAVSKLKLWV